MVRLGCWQFDLPEYFVARYMGELAAWAKNFGKIGPIKSIVLREGYYSDASPDEEQGAQLIQVKLLAKRGLKYVEAAPLRERDARNIANHCQKMRDFNISPRAQLIEPPRPWLPFMPEIVKG